MGHGAVLTAQTPASAWSGPNAAGQFTASPFVLPAPWTVCVHSYVPTLSGTYLYYVVANTNNIYCYGDVGAGNTLAFYSPGTGAINGPANSMATGEQTIAWSCDGSTVRIYAGGTQVASGPGTVDWPFFSVAVQGSWPAGALIRDVTVWQTALNAAQVAAL
jgi:Concanavalin A-like lectin/glucanases superfamily